MRRIPAWALLALFSFSLIAPALAWNPDSKLPACCRREGKHHCAMDNALSPASPAVQALCPFYPQTGAAPAYAKTAVAWAASQAVAAVFSHPAGRARTEGLSRVSFSRTRQKRGPPSFLS
ncbi:MAG: hypothetical protein LAP40_06320 [Acidobacteriia bacterium]|nr:hypothetical protein [Terriglobia bacterium]